MMAGKHATPIVIRRSASTTFNNESSPTPSLKRPAPPYSNEASPTSTFKRPAKQRPNLAEVSDIGDEDVQEEERLRASVPNENWDGTGRLMTSSQAFGVPENEDHEHAISTPENGILEDEELKDWDQHADMIAANQELEDSLTEDNSGVQGPVVDPNRYIPSAIDRLLVKMWYEDDKGSQDIAHKLRDLGGETLQWTAGHVLRRLQIIRDKFQGWKDVNIHQPALADRIKSMSVDEIMAVLATDPLIAEDVVSWSTIADGIQPTSVLHTVSERLRVRRSTMVEASPMPRKTLKRGTPEFSAYTAARLRAWRIKNLRQTWTSKKAELSRQTNARKDALQKATLAQEASALEGNARPAGLSGWHRLWTTREDGFAISLQQINPYITATEVLQRSSAHWSGTAGLTSNILADRDAIEAAKPLNSSEIRDAANASEATMSLRCSKCSKTFEDEAPKFAVSTGEYLRRKRACPWCHNSSSHRPNDGRSSRILWHFVNRKDQRQDGGPADHASEVTMTTKCSTKEIDGTSNVRPTKKRTYSMVVDEEDAEEPNRLRIPKLRRPTKKTEASSLRVPVLSNHRTSAVLPDSTLLGVKDQPADLVPSKTADKQRNAPRKSAATISASTTHTRSPLDASEAFLSVKCHHCSRVFIDKTPTYAKVEGWYLRKKKICPGCKREICPHPSDGRVSRDHRKYLQTMR